MKTQSSSQSSLLNRYWTMSPPDGAQVDRLLEVFNRLLAADGYEARSLICEVSDAAPAAPHLRRAKAMDEGGRGMYLISQLGDH